MIPRCSAAAVILILASCGRSAPPDAPAVDTSERVQLIEDFEDDALWSIDAAANHAALRADDAHATHGALALAAEIADNGRGKLILRKEVDDDFSRVRRVLIDAHLGAGAGELQVALRTKKGTQFEFARITLEPGANRDLEFDLTKGALISGTWDQWLKERAQVERLVLHWHGTGSASIALDHLRALAIGPVRRRVTPTIVRLGAAPDRVGLRRLFAVEVELARPTTPTLAGDRAFAHASDVRLRLRAPDGQRLDVRGFATGVTSDQGSATWTYDTRFVPRQPGEWRWQLLIGDGVGSIATTPASFVCDPADPGPGIVGIDAGDPRWLSDEDGNFVYPIGMNVAWAGDYAPYFAALAEAGADTARVWICPWNHPLDKDRRFDPPDFANAAAIDRMFAQAELHGIRVVLVMQFHGALTWDWARNPWNKANGGPCTDAREFWMNGDARERFRRYLDYCIARWAHSPSLLAWELLNEADLCPAAEPEHIVDWHRAMAAHVRRADPYDHLITTSVAHGWNLRGLWAVEDIDLVQPHRYGGDLAKHLDEVPALAGGRKPALLGEFGRGWEAKDDQADSEGRLLRQALWLNWLGDACGAPLPWWWDTHLERQDLVGMFAPLARFVAGEDRRGRHFTRVSAEGEGWTMDAAVAPDVAYAYWHDPASVAEPRAAAVAGLTDERDAVSLSPVLPGTWRIEWWNVGDPTVTPEVAEITVGADATLRLAPGVRSGDVALKARRSDAVPSVTVEPR